MCPAMVRSCVTEMAIISGLLSRRRSGLQLLNSKGAKAYSIDHALITPLTGINAAQAAYT